MAESTDGAPGKSTVEPDRIATGDDAWYRELFDASDEILYALNESGTILDVNRQVEAITGFTREELIGGPVTRLVPEDYHDLMRQMLARKNDGTQSTAYELEVLTKSGGRACLEVRSRLMTRPGKPTVIYGSARDITDRRAMERTLRESEERFRSLSTASPVGIYLTDTRGACTYVNPRCQEICGFSSDEALAHGWLHRVHPDDQQRISAAWAEHIDSGRGFVRTMRFLHSDGAIRWALVRSAPLYSDQGVVTGRVGTVEDITGRRTAAEALRLSEARYRSMFEQSPFSIQVFAPDGETLRVNKVWEDLWGISLAQLGRYNIRKDQQLVEAGVMPLIEKGFAGEAAEIPPIQYVPARTISAEGAVPFRWVSAHIYPVKDNEGVVREVVLVHEDVTRRMQAETALRDREASYRTLTEAIPAFVFTNSRDGACTYCNQRWFDYTGLTLEETLGDGWTRAIHPDDLERTAEWWRSTVAAGLPADTEYRIRGREGGYRWFLSRTAPVFDGDGTISQWVGTVNDITDLKQAEAARLDAESRYQGFFERAVEGIFQTGRGGRLLVANPATARMFGFDSPGQLLASEASARDMFHPEDRRAYLDRLFSHGEVTDFEMRLRRRDGQVIWLSVSARALRDATGRVVGDEGMATDITARKHAEFALKQSRDQLEAILRSIPDGVTMQDAEGRLLYANDAAAVLCGFASADEMVEASPGEILNRFEIFDEAGEPFSLTDLPARRVIAGEPADEIVLQFKTRATGELRWSIVRAAPVHDEQGRITYAISGFQDITRLKQVESGLRFLAESSNILSSSLDYETTLRNIARLSLPGFADGCTMHLVDEAGEINQLVVAHVNPAREAAAREMNLRYPPQPDAQVGPRKVIRTGESEFRPEIRTEWVASLIRDPERQRLFRNLNLRSSIGVPLVTRGRILGAATFVITESGRRYTEADFALAEELGRRIAIAIENARLYRDAQNALQRESSARAEAEQHAGRLARLQGVTAALSEASTPAQVAEVLVQHGRDMLGATAGSLALLTLDGQELEILSSIGYPSEVIAPWQRFPIELTTPLNEAAREGRPVWIGSLEERDTRFQAQATPHSTAAFQASASVPLRLGARVLGAAGFSFAEPRAFSRDDQVLVLAMAQLGAQALERARLFATERQAREEAEAVNRAKDEFLSVLSHELRTPLTPILGYVGLLRRRSGPDDRGIRPALDVIQRSAQAQARLVEDLLDVSRIVTGKLHLEMEEVHLAPVIAHAVETVRPAAHEKQVVLHVDTGDSAARINGDPGRLQQVVWNLLVNAIKFTPAGGRIDVELRREGEHACIVVRDTGAGIPVDFLPRVFDRFRQADASSSRSYGGLGLGLAIVRHVVEMHNGAVTAESEGPGHGATFTVRLPLLEPHLRTDPLTQDPASEVAGYEAGRLPGVNILVVEDNADTRQFLVVLLQMEGATVEAADSGETALRLDLPRPPDILLVDIGLPGQDGYSLLPHLRARFGSEGTHLPAIALTAFASDHDRARALAAGFDEHLEKPVDTDRVVDSINRFVRRSVTSAEIA